MNEKKDNKTPQTHSIEPGHPDYKPGHTGVPDVAVLDEDAKAEQEYDENKQPKQNTDDEERKVVNEQEQDQVVNDDEAATETKQPAKMSDKPKQEVNPQER